jgi:hypothetical protein
MLKLNRAIILSNIQEAREQLQKIEARIAANEPLKPVQFQVAMQHAFHHLNFAWNARHWPMKRYENLTKDDFDSAGSFPTDLAFDD